MDILFQSLVADRMSGEMTFNLGISFIIIKKGFFHLEQFIRESFHDLPQVRIMVDRRWHNRRRQGDETSCPQKERRENSDRRCVTSAIDFVMGGKDSRNQEPASS